MRRATSPRNAAGPSSTSPTTDALLGRIASLARTVTIGVQPLGMLAGGLLDAVGGGATLLVMGGGAVVAVVGVGSRSSLRTAEVRAG